MMRNHVRLWGWAAALVFMMASSPALPQEPPEGGTSIIVLGFKGKKAGNFRERVVKALKAEGFELISPAKMKQAASEMGEKTIPAETEKRIELAEKLGADAFLTGTFALKKGGVRALSITVFVPCEKGEGRPVDEEWTGAIGEEIVASIVKKITDAIDKGNKACAKAEQKAAFVSETLGAEEEEEGKKIEGGEEEEEEGAPAGKAGKKKKKKEKAKRETLPHCRLGGPRCGLPPALLVDAGFLLSTRRLSVSADSYTYYYDGTYTPMAGVFLDLHILRFFRDNPVFSVGILFDFAHSFGLSSEPKGAGAVSIDTKDMRLKVGLEFVVAPKPGKIPLWIFVDAGWAMHDFKIGMDPAENPIIASFGYRMVDIGLGIDADLVRRWLAIRVRLGLLVPYDLGRAESFYGDKAESRFGFSPGIRLHGVFVGGFHWALGFDFIGAIAKFKGAGSIEGNGYESGKKLTDYYPTGYFLLGYRY
jgi:hypothetical protein